MAFEVWIGSLKNSAASLRLAQRADRTDRGLKKHQVSFATTNCYWREPLARKAGPTV